VADVVQPRHSIDRAGTRSAAYLVTLLLKFKWVVKFIFSKTKR
jgi:hypothetical protein